MVKKNASRFIRDLNLAQSGDWEGLTEELHTGSDRATAILGGVFLDEQLQRLIQGFLIDEKDIIDGLFGIEQPIGTFSSRIKISYGMGLINREIFEDLNTIRQIRNIFAHTLHGISFSSTDISHWCNNLQISKRLIPKEMNVSHPRQIFISAVLFIASYLYSKNIQIESVKRVVPDDQLHIQWNVAGNPDEIENQDPYFLVSNPNTLPIDQSKDQRGAG